MAEPLIEVTPASVSHQPLLANLLELYAHDFSEFYPLTIGEDGKFGYPRLPLYWSEPNRHPFLVRVNGSPAGVVLVTGRDFVWDMTEFFIVRGCRRRGVGTEAAHAVWKLLPGAWKVRVRNANVNALRFWGPAVSAFAGQTIEPAKSELWSVFSFDAR
jgi:predicted acetyltransferase